MKEENEDFNENGEKKKTKYEKGVLNHDYQSENHKLGHIKTNEQLQARCKKNKERMLECLEQSNGIVSMACKLYGCDRKQFYDWRNSDAEFAKKVEEINDVAIDYVETALFKNIEDGKEASCIFYLKTKAKHRGYNENPDIKFDGQINIEVVAPKRIDNVINIDDIQNKKLE